MRSPVHLLSPEVSPATFRRTVGCFPTGVAAVCALVDGEPVGLAASSFASASLEPPMVLFCAARASLTWPDLRRAQRLGLSVLGQHQADLCRQLAGPRADRFAGTPWDSTADGAVLIEGAVAWLECRVEREVPAGDHWLVLLKVEAVMSAPGTRPLVFHESRFKHLIG